MGAYTTEAGLAAPPAVVQWDCVSGIRGRNPAGIAWVESQLQGEDTTNAVAALEAAAKLDQHGIFIALNAHAGTDNPNWIQATWNLRGTYKKTSRTLVLLCPSITLPAELSQDVMIIDDPLPGSDRLQDIARDILKAAGNESPEPSMVEKAVDATMGLSGFAAEQACAMSLRRGDTGIEYSVEDLWTRKARMIEQTPGLSVWKSGVTFGDIAGYCNVKRFLTLVCQGQHAPRGIVFIDEIEKMLAGSKGDTSGVSQGILGTLLSYMQDNNASGSIFIGPPGSGKSEVAKGLGTTAGVPTIAFDMNAMKDSLVGKTEERLRDALKVVSAVTQGRAFFVATCNSIASLPPELRRRFKSGTFFFDLPTAEERASIWQMYRGKYGIPADDLTPENDDGWTGAEIRNCCELAGETLQVPLREAAQFVVPVAKSAADEITALRAQCSGKYISASNPGVYRHEAVAAAETTRSIMGRLED